MCLTFIVLIFHSGINGFHHSICRFQVTLSPCKSAISLPVQHLHVAGATSARVTHFLGSQHQFVRNSDIYLCLLLIILWFYGKSDEVDFEMLQFDSLWRQRESAKKNERTAVMAESRWYIERLFLKSEHWVGNFLIRQQKMVRHKL